MKYAFTGSRVLLGLIFLIFGLNGFFNFLPPQPPLPEAALKFVMALVETGYMMKLVKTIEVLSGILLLFNLFVPLALLLLAPIVVNIFLFHTILAPSLALPVLIIALGCIVAWDRKAQFASVLRIK